MKIHFKTLDYQTDSVDAVADCFIGQPKSNGVQYTIDKGRTRPVAQPSFLSNDGSVIHSGSTNYNGQSIDDDDGFGFKNAQLFDINDILHNIQKVQARQGLPSSSALITDDNGKNKNLTGSLLNLNIEMETGTGKTYCYIRTMFELNKRYGWSKFIVVVPSIAIREGVYKSFTMMADHFQQEYGKKARFFIYDSKQLHHLESFSSDSGVNVMIINVQAFNSIKEGNTAARKIYAELDEFQSRRPIDVISRNNPILILDEPQKMQGDSTLKALSNFNPLFILRYSATHKRDYNLIYRLDALDAYNQKLVKRITVKGIETKGLSGTHSYLYLQDIVVSKSAPVARLELEIKQKNGFKREIRKVEKGDDLYAISNDAEQYKDRYIISEIDARDGSVHFVNGKTIYVGQAQGQLDEKALRTIQIRETIKAHIAKEKDLFKKGIKVLSLFFIDEVAKYRQYDENGSAVDGEYAKIFIEQYKQILDEESDLNIEDDDYKNYLKSIDVNRTHEGYFSIDKKTKRMVEPAKFVKDEDKMNVADDIDAYDLILKDKESLLAFPDKNDSDEDKHKKNVRFIFSHSALREGWDNPNIFVICTLKHSDNVISRRQEVGRGLRLAVNKNGDRMDSHYLGAEGAVHSINDLTVVTNESYTQFVTELQSEIIKTLASRPTTATPDYFKGKTIYDNDGKQVIINGDMANKIYKYLIKHNYIDEEDKITSQYREDKANGQLAPLPEALQTFEESIYKLTDAILNPTILADMFGNDNKTISNPINKRNLDRKEFQALWSQINKKAIYQIALDSDILVTNSIDAIQKVADKRNNNFVETLTYVVRTGEQVDNLSKEQLSDNQGFGKTTIQTEKPKISTHTDVSYDLVGDIAERTNLTRKTIVRILQGIAKQIFLQFKNNPEAFIREVSEIINEQQASMLIQNLQYYPIEKRYLANEIFVTNKVPSTAMKVEKHVWEYINTDSKVEKKLAENLESAVDEVIVYAKLPDTFRIPTPFGSYNPDWAIAFNQEKVRHIYFVAETKGSSLDKDLKDAEKRKIESAKIFFNTLADSSIPTDQQVKYGVISNYDELEQIIGIKEMGA
ncbi:type III restriction-modification system restriction subunit [Actinobacillus delphinicola]|uniref:Type III restriction-modification system restriction subunit n=2 Tax=Actinobacillus delphinicola TaxID=51161 RepID=A0A448TVN6_9PAST|nr:type III restriction-modification system restriction subunit [Actinobacillus delphinicola]